MQNVLDAKPWMLDPRVTPLPWREDIYHEIQSRPLTIGVLVDDGVVKVHPPIERVLRDLEAKLKAAGHDIVVWDSSHHRECIEIMVSKIPLWHGLLRSPDKGFVLHSRRRRRHQKRG